MKTYNEFIEAAMAIPAAAGIIKMAVPVVGGAVKAVKAITNRETGLSDSERKRVDVLVDKARRLRKNREAQETEKAILDYGRKKKEEKNLPEGYKGQRKEDALNARYKDLQNPNPPKTPLQIKKDILMKKV
tara:strand:+ start:1008 stop:1400 length:393 start_codon:yes stop_codon:yes gene_type:complete